MDHALAPDPVLAYLFPRPRSVSCFDVERSRNKKSSTMISRLAPSVARLRSWAWSLHRSYLAVATRPTVPRFRDPLLSRRTRAPEILDGNNEGHTIPFPVRNEGLIGIEGNFRKIKTSVFRNRNLDPKTSPRQN